MARSNHERACPMRAKTILVLFAAVFFALLAGRAAAQRSQAEAERAEAERARALQAQKEAQAQRDEARKAQAEAQQAQEEAARLKDELEATRKKTEQALQDAARQADQAKKAEAKARALPRGTDESVRDKLKALADRKARLLLELEAHKRAILVEVKQLEQQEAKLRASRTDADQPAGTSTVDKKLDQILDRLDQLEKRLDRLERRLPAGSIKRVRPLDEKFFPGPPGK